MRVKDVFPILAALVLLAFCTACPKSSTTPPVPPAPTAAALSKPTIDVFVAEPATVTGPEGSSLRWTVRDAVHVRIDNGVGEVELSGSHPVKPEGTTTYNLEATNSAGTTTAVLVVNVNALSSSEMTANRKRAGAATAEVLATQLQDIHFSYNTEGILDDEKAILDSDTTVLKSLFAADPDAVIIIEGHCDERGSSEYNIALGDKRAEFVRGIFIRSGLPESKLNTISFGKEKPTCLDATEVCFSRNRRVHFSASR